MCAAVVTAVNSLLRPYKGLAVDLWAIQGLVLPAESTPPMKAKVKRPGQMSGALLASASG
jgi:hypothetical protein